MTARCPSDLALESYLLAPARSRLGAHLDSCEACRTRIARMREEGDEFRQFVFPATVEAVEDAAERRRPRLSFIFAPIGAFAALAAALLLFVKVQGPGGPSPDYVGIKGGEVGLGVFVNALEGARPVEDGAQVPANAALRFTVNPKSHCCLWIVSVDAKGEVSRLYPPEGTKPDNRLPGPVPGGAVLDGQPGPERVFAVCASERTSWDEIRRAASPAGASADTVRSVRKLGAPLSGATYSTLLLEKVP